MTPTDGLRAPLGLAASADHGSGALGARLRRLADHLLAPVDVAWLAIYRVLFGLALAVSMERFLAYGWVDSLLAGPRFRFHYWGFGWVPVATSGALHVVFWGLFGLAIAIALGLAFRITAPLFALGLTYVQLLDVSTYLNHYYLAGLLAWLLAITPANRAWSVDAWLRARAGRRTEPESAGVARAWLWLFRIQIGVVYVFAGLAKAGPDWLLHGQPLGIWLGANTHLPIVGHLFTLPHVPLLMSWMGFLFDTTIVGWLLWRRTRPFAYAVVLLFHVMTKLLFDIGMFPIIMSLSALVFFDPSWPRRLLRLRPFAPSERARALRPRRPYHELALGLGAFYCAAQILMPLRAHAYGGNVLWHEQGMRFSWRVMIRAKGGSTTFLVKDKATGHVVHVSPSRYLTAFQENEMSGQPDLVLQLAHRVREDFAERGLGDVEVRAESIASLNGRRGAPLIDPEIDLAAIEDGIGPASYVLPAPATPPPATRPVR